MKNNIDPGKLGLARLSDEIKSLNNLAKASFYFKEHCDSTNSIMCRCILVDAILFQGIYYVDCLLYHMRNCLKQKYPT